MIFKVAQKEIWVIFLANFVTKNYKKSPNLVTLV